MVEGRLGEELRYQKRLSTVSGYLGDFSPSVIHGQGLDQSSSMGFNL
jgi:hypothetical protein